MRVAGKTGAGMALALFLVALVSSYAGYSGTPALAQYEEVAPEGQYDAPPAGTASPGEQYGAPAEGSDGGGDTAGDGSTTAPVGGGATVPEEGDEEDEAEGAGPRSPEGGEIYDLGWRYLRDAGAFVAVASLIATVLFFVERRADRPEP